MSNNNESVVESYLHECVEGIGGTTRKFVSPNHVGVPDRIVFFRGLVELVEVKTTMGKLSSAQIREHTRLREHGATVSTVHGKRGVDVYIKNLRARVAVHEY